MAPAYLRASHLNVGWVFLNGLRAVVVVLPKPWTPPAASGASGNNLASVDSGNDLTEESDHYVFDATRPAELRPLRRRLRDGRSGWYCFQGDVMEVPPTESCRLDANLRDTQKSVLTRLLEDATKASTQKERRRNAEERKRRREPGLQTGQAIKARRLFTSGTCAEGVVADESEPGRCMEALLTFVDTVQTPEWDIALSYTSDPLFAPTVARRYIHVLKTATHHLRRGYMPRREQLSSPRGRIVPISAARAEDSGSSAIECLFEEFTFDRPLYRVLATALRQALGIISVEPEGNDNVLRDAAALRHQLAEVVPMSVGQARSAAARLRLLPHERSRWEQPLRMAIAVLNQLSPMAEDDRQHDETSDVSIQSAPLWEALIARALQAAGLDKDSVLASALSTGEDPDAVAKRQRLNIAQPWQVSGVPFRCDLITFLVPDSTSILPRALIVDAKYQWLPVQKDSDGNLKKYVPVDQLRQVFAYGMLWCEGVDLAAAGHFQGCLDVALIHLRGNEAISLNQGNAFEIRPHLKPAAADGIGGVGALLMRRLNLYVHEMDFPRVADCRSDAALHAWLANAGGTLIKALRAPAFAQAEKANRARLQ